MTPNTKIIGEGAESIEEMQDQDSSITEQGV